MNNTKMLQIPRKTRGSHSEMLQNTVKIAISSSKMLQIAREADRTGESKKKTQRKNKSKHFRTLQKFEKLTIVINRSEVLKTEEQQIFGKTACGQGPCWAAQP